MSFLFAIRLLGVAPRHHSRVIRRSAWRINSCYTLNGAPRLIRAFCELWSPLKEGFMPAPETIDYEGVSNDLLVTATPGLPLTAQKTSNKVKDVKAKQKRMTPAANYKEKEEVRHVRTAEGQPPTPSPRESRKLLLRAFSHPEGSSERRQAFSKYLNALHDEHAKAVPHVCY